ncbi:MAG: bifunctional diaminohydroxyphosphoribosylaminopyrimidine deaminase/5-amino-6-(5-phosphoribosylamino)uracil reductase RibD [bacterium]|nr:bifunctional diaminohydroxyphosphoribosylaminopyrimidine deaminase/5-amino-6-(5-phosphoribosylamino)uracil reductase RibD [bacterium]
MNYEFYMKKCIELAGLSEGYVSPNPLVGCVITDDDGNIVAQGRHEKFGEAHAEQNAIKQAGDKARGATLFVNLEPCNHQGKTPPCSEMIIKAGIKKVVIGALDENKIAKGGIEVLKNAGIEVVSGVMEKECRKLNEIFFFSLHNKRPFIAIKTATTLDGKIAAQDNSSKWITSDASRAEVQRLRNKYDAVLTTSKTVKIDNPSLTCRMDGGRNPIRVVIDRNNELGNEYKVFNNDGTRVIKYSGEINEMMPFLYDNGIKSLLVEAGGTFCGALVAAGFADKIYHFIAPKILGNDKSISWVSGLNVKNINEAVNFKIIDIVRFAPDLMLELEPQL